jgi:hypothetical protein
LPRGRPGVAVEGSPEGPVATADLACRDHRDRHGPAVLVEPRGGDKGSLTRERTDEEVQHVQHKLDRQVQSGEIDEETKLRELTTMANEKIESEVLIPLSAAAFGMALTIGIKGGKLKYRLQTISKLVAEAQKQKEQEARKKKNAPL